MSKIVSITAIALILAAIAIVIMMPSRGTMFAAVCISLVSIILVVYNTSRVYEKYEDASTPEAKTSTVNLNSMLDEYGFTSITNLRNFIQRNYNEDLTRIKHDNTLTLYYSVFSIESAPEDQTRMWRNISPYFQNAIKTTKDACSVTPFNRTHLEFDETPFVNRSIGLEMLSNKISGPLSHQLGIAGNGTFSIFIVIHFNGFSSNNSMNYELFKIYGNTVSNNAVSLVIGSQPVAQTVNSPSGPIPTNVFEAQVSVVYGTQTLTPDDASSIQIDTSKTYMFIVNKTSKKLSLVMHDLADNKTKGAKIIDGVELEDPSVLMSNKDMSINTNKNLNANIFAFGVYNMYIVDDTALRNHMYTELFKTSEAFMKIARSMLSMQEYIDQVKACPFSDTVCQACNINDWTDFQNLLQSSPECKSAIDEYCSKNIKDPRCRCWDPLVNTSECKAYTSIFRQTACLNVDNIDIEMLSKIKTKYNLCDCNDIDKLVEKTTNAMREEAAPKLTNPVLPVKNKADAAYYGSPIQINTADNGGEDEDMMMPLTKNENEEKKSSWAFWKWLF